MRPFTRVRYFNGQVLSADDLTAEQQYFREKHQLHNRLLHGWGIVTGLDVSVDETGVHVAPGVALDCSGREIIACEPMALPYPSTGRTGYVTVHYAEWGPQNSRMEESFQLMIEPDDPCREHTRSRRPCEESHAIPLALIRCRRGRWRVDRKFRRRRV